MQYIDAQANSAQVSLNTSRITSLAAAGRAAVTQACWIAAVVFERLESAMQALESLEPESRALPARPELAWRFAARLKYPHPRNDQRARRGPGRKP